MKQLLGKFGQIGMIPMLTIAGSILIAIIGGYFSQASRTDTKLESAKEEQQIAQLAIVQRLSVAETSVVSIKEDLKEIKSDVKSLLKLLR